MLLGSAENKPEVMALELLRLKRPICIGLLERTGTQQDLSTKISKAMSRRGGFAIGTNTACITNSQLKISPEDNGCILTPKKYGSNVHAQLTDFFLQQKFQAAQSQADASTDVFKLQPIAKEIRPEMAQAFADIANFEFTPVCIEGSKRDLPWAKRFENSGFGRVLNKYPEEISTTFHQPILRLYMDIDDEIRVVINSEILTQQVEVKIPVREFAKNSSEVYELKASILRRLNFGAIRVPRTYKMELCNK